MCDDIQELTKLRVHNIMWVPVTRFFSHLFLFVALLTAAVLVSGCSENVFSSASARPLAPPIADIDQLETTQDFLGAIRALDATQKKIAFVLIREKVEENLQMVFEESARSEASPKSRTDALKLMAYNYRTLGRVAESADWSEMAGLYSDNSALAVALVRGEVSIENLDRLMGPIRAQIMEQRNTFVSEERDTAAVDGLEGLVDKFSTRIVVTAKLSVWEFDVSR